MPAVPDAPPTPEPPAAPPVARPPVERHRAPALWLVVTGIVVAATTAAVDGARPAAILLGVTLLVAGLARVTRRGRQPEGIAVRSTWWDTVVLWGLGAGILLLQGTPGV